MPSERDCVDHLVRVVAHRDQSLRETVALGLLVASKWDRARARTPGLTTPTIEKVADCDNFTAAELEAFREAASRVLSEHLTSSAYLKPSWWSGVWQGVTAACIYSIFLAAAVIIVKLSGSDVLTLARDVLGIRNPQ